MRNAQPRTSDQVTSSAYLSVACLPDGRYSVTYTRGNVSRQSYASSQEQVISQAQRAGGLPIHTDDEALRQRCQEVALPLL